MLVPATVEMIPSGVTRRTPCASLSAMKMLPATSAMAMCGLESCALVAGPSSKLACHLFTPAPVTPPAPATVLKSEYDSVKLVKPSRPFERSAAHARKNSVVPDGASFRNAPWFVVKEFAYGTQGPVTAEARSTPQTPLVNALVKARFPSRSYEAIPRS